MEKSSLVDPLTTNNAIYSSLLTLNVELSLAKSNHSQKTLSISISEK